MADSLLLVPVQLQAFVLNPAVCNTGQDGDDGARIVPITQPNYTFLRLDNFVLQSDVMNHADMHNSAPADKNSRMTDLGARPDPAPRRNRHGVYIHWILPQVYRTGVTSADSVPENRRDHERLQRGLPPRDKNLKTAESSNTPEFLQPPTRWIVVRKLDLDSISPESAKSSFKEYQAWVIESDYRWKLDCIPADYDLEVDVSPFVVGVADGHDGRDANIVQQAEVFVGRKTPLEKWTSGQEKGTAYIDNMSLLRSNNQLFADFQLHNSNVFSILDNFQYDGPDGSPLYLDHANASYYLFGWHKDNVTDPLYDESRQFTHSQKLDGLFMTLVDSGISEVTDAWLKSSDPARLCCHGAIYDVKWDHSSKPKSVPADDYAARIKNHEVAALSIGTTPMDALLTYCKAREGHEEGLIAKLEEDILAIDSLLHARDDGVEGQREAKDTVYNWNFSRAKGGTHFFLGGEDSTGRPTKPNDDSIGALEEINQLQQLLDGCDRLARQRRWDMFSLWWKYVSDVSNKDRPSKNPTYNSQATDLATRISQMQSFIVTLRRQIEDKRQQNTPLATSKTGTLPFFYRARDPTLLVGGVESGWPADFSNNVSVRLPVQTVVSDHVPDELNQLGLDIQKAFPDTLPLKEVASLLGEFFALLPEQQPSKDPPKEHAYPQFHDSPGGEATLRDEWGDRQPWFPLYVEWEAEYTHVPFEWWALDEQASRLSDNKLVRYGVEVPSGKPLWEEIAKRLQSPNTKEPPDTRILSGRVLILPQPSFSLAAKVRQLFSDTPPKILNEYLSEDERKNLLDHINELSYLSCPLSGLTEGLLTLNQGTHVKPEYKEVARDGDKVTAVGAAQFNQAGLTKENIELIAGNSAFTPFAASASFANDKYCPFKPATHGQMRFRKLNIIDKFGQAVVAIDPQPRLEGHPPLYPCISDFYEPQGVQVGDEKVANTVIQNNGGACEFIQLPPQINQNARLNAEFITTTALPAPTPAPPTSTGKPKAKETQSPPYWRPTTEWESPIWGWIVTNYADYGIQLFLKDGTFYGEVRIGGPNGALESPKWSPFEPPKPSPTTTSNDLARLDALIQRLRQPDYLKGFWSMLTMALDSLPPAPSSYAQFLGSVVGKPLALVNTGWSLELDSPPLTNQSTRSKISTPERQLIDPSNPDDGYIFHVKLGDKEREYDGLVGYFDGYSQPDPESGEELAYDFVKTYFVSKNNEFKNLIPIAKDNYPTFKPYYVPPFPEDDPPNYSGLVSPRSYADQHNSQLGLHVFGAIVDPFTAIHAYSSFLPATALALRSWTWQDALNNMVAFLHAGPLTLIDDVKGYDPSRKLTADIAKERPPVNVGLPALAAGDWNWLQPYVDPTPPQDQGKEEEDVPVPVYNAYGIEKKGNLLSPGFQNAPYTAVEGFLQLRRPIMTEDPKTDDDGDNGE